jgi:hypothetical protein
MLLLELEGYKYVFQILRALMIFMSTNLWLDKL